MSFTSGDLVEIHSTTDPQLDGNYGIIVGRQSVHPEMTVFIVELEIPVTYDDGFVAKAITITEHCLKQPSGALIAPEDWPEHHA